MKLMILPAAALLCAGAAHAEAIITSVDSGTPAPLASHCAIAAATPTGADVECLIATASPGKRRTDPPLARIVFQAQFAPSTCKAPPAQEIDLRAARPVEHPPGALPVVVAPPRAARCAF